MNLFANKPMPTINGSAYTITVLKDSEGRAVGLKFDMLSETDGPIKSIPLEIMLAAPVCKELLSQPQSRRW
jgi:hypothetical protein